MILYAIRIVWIASHLCVLFKGGIVHAGYRWWAFYIGLSCFLVAAYWPELLPGWEAEFAPFLVGVLLLRTLACLEALHVQTREFPRWPRMMAGAFLFGFVAVLVIHGVRDDRWRGNFVELRRYLQIWTAAALCSAQYMMIDRAWCNPAADWHARLLTVLAVNHGAVSVWCIRSHPSGPAWLNINAFSIAVDAAVYLLWTFCGSANPNRQRVCKPE